MAQLDELKAALTEVNGKLDGINDKVDEVKSETAAVPPLVQALIDKLSALPTSPDLTEAIAMAQNISARVSGLSEKVNAVDADLDSIPAPKV